MTRTDKTARKRKKKFIGMVELRERWNDCSHMFIENKIRNDPNFPSVYRIGRHRFFDEEELEKYERQSVVEQ
jgi:hypothetical protein